MDQRISLITLAVTDMAQSATVYEALGWARVESPDGVIAFDLLGQVLGLYPKTGLAEDLGMDPSAIGGFSGMTLGYNTREKPEVDQVMARAEAAGAQVLKPAQDVFWGGYHGYFADLDGHVWEVAHNPFSPLGPNGEFQWNGAG
jgi:predicted lactoylglutathione lyase